MAVYVDDARLPYGRMLMSHMVADTTEELLGMADRIGVARRWIQKAGTPGEHFDVCQEKRRAAIAAGAVAVSSRELVRIVRARRSHHRRGEGKVPRELEGGNAALAAR